jgi:integrase
LPREFTPECLVAKTTQKKTGKTIWLPLQPELIEALNASPRGRREYAVVTAYEKPFSAKSLTMQMRKWVKAAGLGPGHTLHGLRKTLGKRLAESRATTREIMAILGHDDIAYARTLHAGGRAKATRQVGDATAGEPEWRTAPANRQITT